MRREEIPSYIVKLGLKQGATDIVANLLEYNRTMIRFSNNEITISKNYQDSLVDIFLMIKKKRAGSTIPVGSVKDLQRAVNKLIEMARISPPADIYAPLPEGPFKYNPTLLEPSRVSFNPDKMVSYVEEAIEGATEAGAKKVAGSLIVTRAKMTLATSGHVNATQERAGIEISVRAFTSDISSGHSVSVAQNEEDFKPAEAGKTAGEIAKASSDPKPGKSGTYTALLGPLIFADLVNQVGIKSSAFIVDAGQSFLVDKIDSEVASEKFTLIDDPTVKGSYGMRAFDDEGVPVRRNILVEKGVLKTYLHNSTTAKKFNAETTGNAGLVSPVPWNLVVEAGDRTFDELLSEIERGIYVTNDWYLRYQNHRKGDFSTIPRDGMFLIKHGRIEAPIRELRISDNMIRILRSIRNLSKSRFWIKWWEVDVPTLTPYAVIEDLNFTKSTM